PRGRDRQRVHRDGPARDRALRWLPERAGERGRESGGDGGGGVASRDGPPDRCHACDVPMAEPIDNRPGLPALAYRVGTWATFLERMKDALAAPGPLAALAPRGPDDPTIALLDAWAVVGDVLSFYQERIANEGYLRTATERRSVLELARAIGYELNPGVAASTHLVWEVDPSTQSVVVAPGTKVQ